MLDVVLAALDGEGLAFLRPARVDGREHERAVVAVDVQRAGPILSHSSGHAPCVARQTYLVRRKDVVMIARRDALRVSLRNTAIVAARAKPTGPAPSPEAPGVEAPC